MSMCPLLLCSQRVVLTSSARLKYSTELSKAGSSRPDKRRFKSRGVEEFIALVKGQLNDTGELRLASLFENCYPNTLGEQSFITLS
jgi:hypothetical protein